MVNFYPIKVGKGLKLVPGQAVDTSYLLAAIIVYGVRVVMLFENLRVSLVVWGHECVGAGIAPNTPH